MKRGLIVDDSAVIRKVASRILELLHFASATAANGHRALDICAAAMPDVILLDWKLPQTDTLEFLRALRALPGGGEPKVIYCATENDSVAIGRALRAGADDVMLKPFDRLAIEEKLAANGLLG
ncbi:response regulator [uncultured Rhodoblastus sp.]|uniref:response regulator n=1 Tax=uncultured Rhodoblastus sp. TaxID=543037 RepID=UPI0025F5470B|nr:response regulator [uncultured Rhodoblastus sp.]